MWIVRIALSRPYTFIVMALLILILGPLTILRTPTDIFPNIGIPVIGVVWGYTGLPPDEMGARIVGNYERALTTTVNNIEHIESQSLNGVGLIKIFFHPGVNVDLALSQVTAISQTVLRSFPPGTTPPLVVAYNASSVPIIQLALSSNKMSEQELFDTGNNFIRTQLATVQGAAVPFPYGGKSRQIQVDLDLHELQAHDLSPADVQNALNNQNLILPMGTEKIGEFEYNIKLNASPAAVQELNDMPIKAENGTVIYVRDVGHVRDGFAPQTNIVRADGQRSVLMTIQKIGNSSTLDIIDRIKALMPAIRDQSPPSLVVKLIGDQSIFVKAAIQGVVREAIIAAILTGLMILLFLGSWRSTLIITISIPLSILCSIIALAACGQTINLMTLGGLALAVGILVDDATVAIENINYHLEQGKDVEPAILDGAQQIAIPALVSTLCICIVFVPMFLLSGVAYYLFVPLAMSVVFAMLASYVLSRTLVPTLAKYWLHKHEKKGQMHEPGEKPKGALGRFQQGFEKRFEHARESYRGTLQKILEAPKIFILLFMGVVIFSGLLFPWLGENFFPSVDTGQMKLHMRTRSGTRIEETARLADRIETEIRNVIPQKELDTIVDNLGLPISGLNLTYSNSAPVGSGDGDIMISLNQDHKPSADYMRELRRDLAHKFPGVTFSFLPADIVSQILNFGLPSPVDVQVTGFNQAANQKYAHEIFDRIAHIPGIADLRIQQSNDEPEIDVNVDRSRAQLLGLTQHDIASNMLITLSGSFQTAPNFWLSPQNGVQYSVVTQMPQYKIDTMQDLENLPLSSGEGTPQILGGIAQFKRGVGSSVVSHWNVAPIVDIYGASQDTDLGSIASRLDAVLQKTKKDVPRGSHVSVRGQIETMRDSFTGLLEGMLFAVVLVYLLIVVNFQSWLDPFIIITALPAALAGILWMLFVTHTTLSVPALTGSIMCIGVATANSILVVSFARERMADGESPMQAALDAGFTRFRPVLMTALAMIIGMVPMALGLGEGGEQNAPLGRAVIGGLSFATVATLFFVPCVFMLMHRWERKRSPEGENKKFDHPREGYSAAAAAATGEAHA